MSRLSFAEALAEDDKKQQAQQQQPQQPQQQVGTGIKPQPAYKDIKDPTKANESNRQIAQTTAGNNSDEPSPIDMGNDPKRFSRGGRETPRTPEEQARIDEHDREVGQMVGHVPVDDTTDSPIDGYGTGGTYSGYGLDVPGGQDGRYGQYGRYGGYYPMDDVQTLDDVTNALMPYHVPNSEELKKEQKRERRDMLIRSLGDGISAIAGLTTAINGGPNIINPEATLTKSGMEMNEKLRKERQQNLLAYTNAALKREQASAARLRAMSAADRARATSEIARMKAEHSIKAAERKLELAKEANEIRQAHNEAMEIIAAERNRIQEEYNQGRLSNAEKKLALDALDAETKRIKAITGGKGKGGGKSGGSGGSGSKDYHTETWTSYEPDRGEVKHYSKVHGSGGSGGSKPSGGTGNGGSGGSGGSGGKKKGRSAVSGVISKHK